jgi:hypothetical protein
MYESNPTAIRQPSGNLTFEKIIGQMPAKTGRNHSQMPCLVLFLEFWPKFNWTSISRLKRTKNRPEVLLFVQPDILYHISMIDICDSEAIFKLSKRRKIENFWTLECTHFKPLSKLLSSGQMPDGAVKCPTGPSNARPGRQIPAYTEVMLSQMLWGCPGGGGLIAVGFDSYITITTGDSTVNN